MSASLEGLSGGEASNELRKAIVFEQLSANSPNSPQSTELTTRNSIICQAGAKLYRAEPIPSFASPFSTAIGVLNEGVEFTGATA